MFMLVVQRICACCVFIFAGLKPVQICFWKICIILGKKSYQQVIAQGYVAVYRLLFFFVWLMKDTAWLMISIHHDSYTPTPTATETDTENTRTQSCLLLSRSLKIDRNGMMKNKYIGYLKINK